MYKQAESSNRTFMELKFCQYVRHEKKQIVLIVPLWN